MYVFLTFISSRVNKVGHTSKIFDFVTITIYYCINRAINNGCNHLKYEANDPLDKIKIQVKTIHPSLIWKKRYRRVNNFKSKVISHCKKKKAMLTAYISSLTCRFKEQEAAKQSSPGQDRDYSKEERIGHCCVQVHGTPWNSNDRSSTLHKGVSDVGHSIKLDHVTWPHIPWYSEGPILRHAKISRVKVTWSHNTPPPFLVGVVGG